MDHLKAAQALADETRDGVVGYMIERALDQLRADTWPETSIFQNKVVLDKSQT
jgi:hypothetical protein